MKGDIMEFYDISKETDEMFNQIVSLGGSL